MVGEILLLTKHCNPLRLQKKNHFHSVQLIPLPYTEILTTWFLLMEGRLLSAIKYIYVFTLCFVSNTAFVVTFIFVQQELKIRLTVQGRLKITRVLFA